MEVCKKTSMSAVINGDLIHTAASMLLIAPTLIPTF